MSGRPKVFLATPLPAEAGARLAADLTALGLTVSGRLGDVPGATSGIASGGDRRVAVVDARLVAHRHALRRILADDRYDAAHIPGVLSVRGDAARALDALLAARAAEAEPGAPAPTPDELAGGLAAAGIQVHRIPLGDLVAAVPDSPAARAEAEAALGTVDEEAIRLTSAVKARDGFFTTFFVSSWSRYLARWCARRGLTPNQITVASLCVALAGAAAAASGTRAGYIAAALALYFSFVLDCVDGQVARYTVNYSQIGAWLDATFDRAKEYAVYAGLALGAARSGDDVWLLAATAMAVQIVRHQLDFAFHECHEERGGEGSGSARLSNRLDSVGWTVWARRMIILPIGERWALIAVLAATTSPRTTFIVLLAAGGFAGCYSLAGRVLRSLPHRGRARDGAAARLRSLCDGGVLADAIGRHYPRGAVWVLAVLALPVAAAVDAAPGVLVGCAVAYVAAAGAAARIAGAGPLMWLVPPLFRAAEYTTVIALVARTDADALPAAFGLVAAAAYHHYDIVYRLRGGHAAPPRWLTWSLGGHEGRVLVLAALAAAGSAALATGTAVLAGAVAAVALAESVAFWARGARVGDDLESDTVVHPPAAPSPGADPAARMPAASTPVHAGQPPVGVPSNGEQP
ncbi:DUF5941 domain-containing protein [Yinghuangia sp. YIM S09857]|uniref:DUF5941 domain-containing protein n=1 Tax=Yinghuangia sp. YIM S09857 TaxID=3436929 RepID=UPI003F52B0C7